MRWLILGPYPPEQGQGSRATAAAAAHAIDAGHDVTVISPRPTAAHRHQPLVGRSSLWALGSLLDAETTLWVRVEPGVLLSRTTDRRVALVERLLVRRLLRRAVRSVIDVGDIDVFPGGRAGALVFGSVDQLVVRSVADRDRLLAAGARPHTVVQADVATEELGASEAVPPRSSDPDPGAPLPPPPDRLARLAPGASRSEIEAVVRARAAEAPVRSAGRR